jgi:hypothetical protein
VSSRGDERGDAEMTARGRAVALAAAALAAYVCAIRTRQLCWGATAHEALKPLPGDDLLPGADLVATRAISVAAPVDEVWPWIAQIGQGRGGFYSYDALENLIGCHMRSADRILPDHQRIVFGDTVHLHPEVALQVVACAPGRSLVLRGAVPMGAVAPPYDTTWAFVLEAAGDGGTRLLVRERYAYLSWWGPALVEAVEVASWVMSQKMLRGIRDRAEHRAV